MTPKSNSKDYMAFIPGWLDDMDLSLVAFRLFCTISRRGDFWESKTKLERRFKVSNRTLVAAFAELISRRLITEEKRVGFADRYRVSANANRALVPGGTT